MRVEPLSLRQPLTETCAEAARAADSCSDAYTPTPSLIQTMREELCFRMPDLANAPPSQSASLPIRGHPRQELGHRPPPGGSERVVRRWGFRTRVQVSPGSRRARRTTRLAEAAAEGPVR